MRFHVPSESIFHTVILTFTTLYNKQSPLNSSRIGTRPSKWYSQEVCFSHDHDCAEALTMLLAGSDTPHVRLLLKHLPTEQMATVAFSGWTQEQPAGAAARVVPDYHLATDKYASIFQETLQPFRTGYRSLQDRAVRSGKQLLLGIMVLFRCAAFPDSSTMVAIYHQKRTQSISHGRYWGYF